MPIVYAISCLMFAAVNDLIFKFYARKNRSIGWYVMIIGIVWTILFILTLKFDFNNWQETLFWGLFSGFFSVGANILLIEAMSYQDAGVCSMIYRFNLVAAALGGILLLNESFTIWKLIGLVFAIVAIALFYKSPAKTLAHDAKHNRNGIILVIIAALFRAGMGVSYKYAFMQGANDSGIITLNGITWILGGFFYALIKEPIFSITDKKSWAYGTVSGFLISGIVLFMALALKNGEASIIIPITQMSFLITFILSIIILKESFSFRKAMGMLAGILCIIVFTIK